MVHNGERAKRLIEKREQANKNGLPNAVKRYMKRTGFNPNPPVLNGDMQNLLLTTSIYFELLGLQSKRWAVSLFYLQGTLSKIAQGKGTQCSHLDLMTDSYA